MAIPLEQFGVFLEDVLRNLTGHGDDGGVVTAGQPDATGRLTPERLGFDDLT